MKIVSHAQIYKITYPNGKIYIGQDRTCDINYFGSAKSELIEMDFPEWRKGIEIKKEVLQEYTHISLIDLNKTEREYIEQYQSNNPEIGYNRNPGFKKYNRKKQYIYESHQN